VVKKVGRPGARSTQEDVKTSVVNLLGENPEGLSFNQIFKQLKSKGVLGSFSVLSRALKDLCEALIVTYEDKPTKAKLPRRVYTLTEPKVLEFIQSYLQSYVKAKEKEKIPLSKLVSEETLLKQLFFLHINNLMSAYRDLLQTENPLEDEARWKLLFNIEFSYVQAFMENVAKAISEGRIPVDIAKKVASEVQVKILGCFSASS
jgi:DNA-binding HxlR family transcriptional regulator